MAGCRSHTRESTDRRRRRYRWRRRSVPVPRAPCSRSSACRSAQSPIQSRSARSIQGHAVRTCTSRPARATAAAVRRAASSTSRRATRATTRRGRQAPDFHEFPGPLQRLPRERPQRGGYPGAYPAQRLGPRHRRPDKAFAAGLEERGEPTRLPTDEERTALVINDATRSPSSCATRRSARASRSTTT